LAVQVADNALSRMGEVRDARAARGELPRALPDGDRSQFHIAVLQTHPVGGKMHELLPNELGMSLTVYPKGQSPEEYTRKLFHSWSQAPKLPLETLIGIERGLRPAAVADGQEDADDHLYAAGFSRWSEWTLGLGQYTALVLPTNETP
ncbi:hypothetical protein G3I76_68435, partial [Streptomyces sp. SID11233]|nr:hypothetical protein [Streptomyces sp. SID11233]